MMMLPTIVMAMAAFVSAVPVFGQEASGQYAFSYFTGNGEDGLHLAHEPNGVNCWVFEVF
jgi:hypothetical protein